MNLEELRKQEIELKFLLAENQQKQIQLSKSAFIEKFGADVGDKVSWTAGSNTYQGIICGIEYISNEILRYIANIINANGKVEKRKTQIWMYSVRNMTVIEKKK